MPAGGGVPTGTTKTVPVLYGNPIGKVHILLAQSPLTCNELGLPTTLGLRTIPLPAIKELGNPAGIVLPAPPKIEEQESATVLNCPLKMEE